ncbi:PhzF family phenazine biosynthesis protein [Ornithinimicrobium pekingense]|uniref:Phenazine biosynthesis protein PhzF n=1 Tax=Ornithinimicrobium pekingense TaxID=384677 RepID=A0ABQ2F411_9MICO|nr:PhzF family phenazine biosynthesis protein [Ornithinimicrobium pekingense]GGK59131.1 phenazine biosynthesis protein PhzF [Ornithinimicrobium pekingense]
MDRPALPRRFSQVDVFGPPGARDGILGNPLAVVHDAEGLGEETLAAFARWTNLSETTFLLPPADPAADYRVRIFTPGGELPFAGHPTLGSAHAWLEAGGRPAHPDRVVQECGAGLVTVRREPRLAFAGPPLVRSGPVEDADRGRVLAALGLSAGDVVAMEWVDNGPGWVGVELADAEAVLAVEPVPEHFPVVDVQDGTLGLAVGVAGRWADPSTGGKDLEVRAFFRDGAQLVEDPVTGSLNAGLAQWLVQAGRLPGRYVAGQGTRLRRDGRVHVETGDGQTWVGGEVVTTVAGEVRLASDGRRG